MEKKYFIICIVCLLLAVSGGVYAGSKEITRTVYDPYGNVIFEDAVPLRQGSGGSARFTSLTTPFTSFVNMRIKSDELTERPFCKIGGSFRSDEYYKDSFKRQSANFHLFRCHTTYELFNRSKIPSSWLQSNLLIYCNDARDIYDNQLNYDIISQRVNAYKLCIVKNLDQTEKNTVLTGFDVGNVEVDSDLVYRTDIAGRTRAALAFADETVEVNGERASYLFGSVEKELILNQEEEYFQIHEGINPSALLSRVVDPIMFNLSRVLMIKKTGGKILYGYEIPVSVLTVNSEEADHAMYVINGSKQELCLNNLGYYNAQKIENTQQAINYPVSCYENLIFINSYMMGKRDAYALFTSLITEN